MIVTEEDITIKQRNKTIREIMKNTSAIYEYHFHSRLRADRTDDTCEMSAIDCAKFILHHCSVERYSFERAFLANLDALSVNQSLVYCDSDELLKVTYKRIS